MFILFIFYLNIEYSVLSTEYLYNNYKLPLCKLPFVFVKYMKFDFF